jgi:hypothetical protein
MKSFIQFTHANTQENTTAAILKFKKKMRREMMIIIDAVLILISSYLTAKVLFIAAVSLLDSKFDIYLPLNRKTKVRKNKKNKLFIYTKYGSISAEYGYDLTFRASSI